MTAHFKALRAVIDGEATTLSVDDAKALHAALCDARSRIVRLDAENDALVDQVLAEERRSLALRLAVYLLACRWAAS